ncbi:MAG TPA: hypothetical protein VG711_04280, partial [Phycisphaerales bacterium]|nr:hypothetical protein [Phycisphaerales bacterium]
NRTLKSSAVIGAALVIFAGTVASFARIAPMLLAEPIEQTPMTAAETSPAQSEPNTGAITSQPEQGSNTSINPSPKPLPSYVLIQDDEDTLKAWVGKNFRELELFQYMPVWPKGLDKGRHYVIFFSRTCEHCEAMFNRDLIHPQDAPVHAVEIPDDLNVLTSAGAWKMPDNPCEILALPLGTRWIITPPLALTIEDGVVICATPHDYRKCLGLPPLPENEP